MKLTTKQIRQIIRAELGGILVQENVGDFQQWLKTQGLYDHFVNDLMYEAGMMDLLTALMEEQFELQKQGPNSMTFRKMSEAGDEVTVTTVTKVVDNIEKQEVYLYLSSVTNPIPYNSAKEAAMGIRDELKPRSFDFSNLL